AAVTGAAPGDTIVFDPHLRGATIALTSGELSVTRNLTIVGLGAGRLTIDGGASSRLFEVGPGVSLSLSGLTLADGQADVGGGVFNAGSLTLDHVTFSHDTALGDSSFTGVGGAVFNDTGALLIATHCAFAANTAQGGAGFGFGGAILSQGT